MSLLLQSNAPADTLAIADLLAPHLKPGDAVMLHGELAAGKTLFVQGLAKRLGFDGSVTSPTYGIADFYPLAEGRMLHIDAYRLSGLPEFRDLGLDEDFDEVITVAEWGEVIAGDFPEHLALHFSFIEGEDEARGIKLVPAGSYWEDSLRLLSLELARFTT